MPRFHLHFDISTLPPDNAFELGTVAIFQGRDAPNGVLCLEKMLEERLMALRQKHMRWAYAAGFKNKLAKNLECGQTPSMWWTSLIYERHPRLSPQLYQIYKLACVELWLGEGKASGLEIYGATPQLQQTLMQLGSTLGINCVCHNGRAKMTEQAGALRKIYQILPAPLRALARLCHWYWTIRRKLPHSANLSAYANADKKSALIVTYFPNLDHELAQKGRFYSRYWEGLHKKLEEQAEIEGGQFTRWLFIHFPAPGLTFAEYIELRDKFANTGKDGLSFNFLEEFVTGKELAQALWRWLKLCFASLKQQKQFAQNCQTEGSKFNFWPYLRSEWAESMRGWRCLERCIFNLAFRRYCQLAGPQRWTLFPLENCPWERMLTEAARTVAANGPVFGAQHSTIRPTDFRYFDDPATFSSPECAAFQPDIIAGNGNAAIRQWQDNGVPPNRIKTVEALRYLYLANRIAIDDNQNEAIKPTRLLIATSFFAGETGFMLALVAQALQTGLLDDFQLILKPHPYLLPTEWLARLPKACAPKITVSTRAIAEELTRGTAVWASNSTTVALEAALAGLPLMVMAANNDFDLCPIQDAKDLLRTANLADVKYCLSNLASPKLESGYLNLDPSLTGWRQLLGLGNK